MKLGSRLIGLDQAPYFIAEMSGNHNQSLERALQIVEAAAKSGAHALKIQTYTPDTMTLNLKEGDFFIKDKGSLWSGRSLYDLYQEAMTPWEWHRPIQERCQALGIDFFSTPFDASAVDFLEELNIPFYKIASFENVDIPLIRRVAQTKKPVIISTGLATLSEISDVVETIRSEGNSDIVLLKCTSAYPALPEFANLATIEGLRSVFGVEVGLSDHTLGATVPIVSVCQGATVIEKHFTLSRADKGVDSEFSMEPSEFKLMIQEVSNAKSSIGAVKFGPTEAELKSLRFRRSLYICEDLKKGDILTEKNLRAIRPGMGLAPKHLPILLGKRVKKEVKLGTPMAWDLI